jgi:gluconate kinase
MATLSPEQAALLKKTYATADEFKASDNFKKMTTGAQNIAL